jgi:integrase
MRGPAWSYRPGSDQGPHGKHKTAYRGQARVILIGPRGQEVLRSWLRVDPWEYLFQPKEGRAAYNAERRKRRKSKVTPSQAKRQPKRNPKRAPRDRYTVITYDQAVAAGCRKAHCLTCAACHRQEGENRRDWLARVAQCEGLNALHWHPNQLRHAKATELRRECDLDTARAVLGHRSPQITEVYAEIDVAKAAEAMTKFG